jgi:hypothetical protein
MKQIAYLLAAAALSFAADVTVGSAETAGCNPMGIG